MKPMMAESLSLELESKPRHPFKIGLGAKSELKRQQAKVARVTSLGTHDRQGMKEQKRVKVKTPSSTEADSIGTSASMSTTRISDGRRKVRTQVIDLEDALATHF